MATTNEIFLEGQAFYDARDFEAAVEKWTQAAEQGNADAQYMLGDCYYSGVGVGKNVHKAVEWFEKAAAQEDDDALDTLYVLAEQGVKDAKEALTRLKQ